MAGAKTSNNEAAALDYFAISLEEVKGE